MENSEKILCNARIKHKITVPAIIVSILWYILSLYIIINGTGKHLTPNGGYWKSLCGIEYENLVPSYMEEPEVHTGLLIIAVLLFLVLTLLPILYFVFSKLIAQNCTLTLTEKQICGQLKTLFGKKQIQIPIEKLDNIMTSSGFMDKLRSGETICVSSNSGMVKFHYVQNADEFVQAALKRIEEVKRSQPATAPQAAPIQHAQPAPVQNVSGSDAMEKINSLRQMLDSGLISQEEFDEKKKDILSKM